MCAIVGFWDSSRRMGLDALERTVLGMASVLQHRGPDDQGAWADENASLALGHRRLAILDLSTEGHQPMLSANQHYVLVFNGEIYNFQSLQTALEQRGHTFRGHSDTEVMLAAFCEWGLLSALERFVGMFAFALWDRWDRKLYLARDRAGEKPLYYGWTDGVFVFGSELKALRAHPRWQAGINRGAVALLVRYGYIPAPHCIFENIYKLAPGCVLTLDESSLRSRQTPEPVPYWSAQTIAGFSAANPFTGTEAEAGERLQTLLLQSVGQQMIADVPLGAFLSGGIDSSLIVSLMQAQSRRPVKTFSIGFRQEKFNEAPFAKAIAAHLGTDHTELYVQDRDLQHVVSRLPGIYDEPLADPSQIPTVLLCQLAGAYVKASLSGDAGDELFGGYDHYRKARRIWRAIDPIPTPLRKQVACGLKSFSSAGLSTEVAPEPVRHILNRLSNLADVLPASGDRSLYQLLMSPNREPHAWLQDASEPETLFESGSIWDTLAEPLQRMTLLDFVSYLPDDILVKVDRAAMSVSLETRVPLLDHRLIEFAFCLPASFKQKGGQGKWLLRQILYKHVPRTLVDRPKRGFAAPIAEWLRGPMRTWADQLLEESRLRQEGFFNVLQIRQSWQEHLSKKRDWSAALWHVLMFQAWLEEQGTIQHRSETGTILFSGAGARFDADQPASVRGSRIVPNPQAGESPKPETQISDSRREFAPAIPEQRRTLIRSFAERVLAAAKIMMGVGFALLTMNLAALWIYDLPSAPNPLFGDVHQPGREFRQRIEGNGSGVFTSNCVRRASLPGANQKPVLMILGNSYTEATQVNDKDHFAHLLEEQLRDIPVLAVGISSYSVADYIAGAATFKKLFRPDWVIIPVRSADFEANAWNKNKGGGYAFFKRGNCPAKTEAPETTPDPKAFTATGSLQIVSQPVPQSGWLSTMTRERFPFWYPLVTFAYLRKADMEAWMLGHERPWFHATVEAAPKSRPEQETEKYPLEDEMKLLAAAYDRRLTLLYLPNFDPLNPSNESETEKKLQELAAKEGVRFVSLREKFPALAGAGHAPYGFSNTRFNWGHWNRSGHEAAAAVLFEESRQLEAQGKLSARTEFADEAARAQSQVIE